MINPKGTTNVELICFKSYGKWNNHKLHGQMTKRRKNCFKREGWVDQSSDKTIGFVWSNWQKSLKSWASLLLCKNTLFVITKPFQIWKASIEISGVCNTWWSRYLDLPKCQTLTMEPAKMPEDLDFTKCVKNIVKILKCIPSCQRITIESAKLMALMMLIGHFNWTWIVRGFYFAKYKISFDLVLGCFETTFCHNQ